MTYHLNMNDTIKSLICTEYLLNDIYICIRIEAFAIMMHNVMDELHLHACYQDCFNVQCLIIKTLEISRIIK